MTDKQFYQNLQSGHHAYSAAMGECETVSVEPCKNQMLCSTSRLSMVVSEKSYQFMLEGQSGQGEAPMSSWSIFAPLVVLMQWILRFAFGETVPVDKDVMYIDPEVQPLNRKLRRKLKGRIPSTGMPVAIRVPSLLRILFKGKRCTQRLEMLVKLTLSNRIRVYGMRFWGTARQLRACLSCVDHGGWTMPATSTVAGGLWQVQLPPN